MIRTIDVSKGDFKEICDVCVIGSGPGGAVAAKELAQAGHNVVLIEEGGHHTVKDWDGRPLKGLLSMYRMSGMTGAVGIPPISITMGRCIGGSSTINSATCFRTPEGILAHWQKTFGLDHLTLKTLEPHFKRVEKNINVTELPWELLGQSAQIVKRGCDRLGLHCRPLKHNVKDCMGCGPCQFGCQEGAKQSMDVTYIPLAAQHGARIYANCRADSLMINKGTIRGVNVSILDPVTRKRKGVGRVNARIVVCACGSMITPSLLLRSGLKDRNIGRHLQIHPGARVVALMNEVVEGWKGVSQGAYVDDFENEGIMLEGIFVHPSVMLSALPGVGLEFKELAMQFPNIAAFGVMVHDETEGRIHKSKSGLATYFIKQTDVDKLKRGVAYTAGIFFAAGAKQVYTGISKKPILKDFQDAEELKSMKIKPSHMEIMAFHPLGTCRMSADPKLGPVKKNGETYEVKNLFITDGSVVPTSLGVNPQITIMAMSSLIAQNIIHRLKHE